MAEMFIKLVNMSLGASLLVVAVLLLRLLFRRAPRWIVCLMWAFVAVRLVLPFSLESDMSLIPDRDPIPTQVIYTQMEVSASNASIIPPYGAVDGGYPTAVTDIGNVRTLPLVLLYIWLAGIALMLVYAAVSYVRLRHHVNTAVRHERGIMQSENISSPFVLGIFRPTIYLPFGISDDDMAHVIAHEKAHIRRGDHFWKPIGFLLLSIYWFNPFIWAAYILLCRDIEAACDEAVIREMEADARRAYSTALLNCSVNRRKIIACPIAFGEVGVKARIKGIMNYKKPTFWVIISALVVCIAVAVCFLTDPKEDADPADTVEVTDTYGVSEMIPHDRGMVDPASDASKAMSLDDVIALSKKGYELTDDDFSGYFFTETGSGLYIRRFDIDDRFYLLTGGTVGDVSFNYVYLCVNGTDEHIDIRDGGVEEFIAAHTHVDEYAGLLLFDKHPLSYLIDLAYTEARGAADKYSLDIKKEYVNIFHNGDGEPVRIIFFSDDPKTSGDGYVSVTLVMGEDGSYIADPSLTVTDA